MTEYVPETGEAWLSKDEYVLTADNLKQYGNTRAYIKARYGDAALTNYDKAGGYENGSQGYDG